MRTVLEFPTKILKCLLRTGGQLIVPGDASNERHHVSRCSSKNHLLHLRNIDYSLRLQPVHKHSHTERISIE